MSSSPELEENSIDGSSELRLKRFTEICLEKIRNLSQTEIREYGKKLELPLARIKKIMKIDELAAGQMISSESPLMLAVAAEFLVEEMTLRAWIHANQNRRKTIQKNDVAQSIAGCEMFDFLIDIVPRDEPTKSKSANNATTESAEGSVVQQPENGQYYFATEEQQQQMGLALGDGVFQIGQSIPLSAIPGQQFVVAMEGGEPIQFLVNPTEQQ